ncbi:hypothetical protein Syun_022679 [Stephania yunnanensis]|uniref:B box-type domain-containing protein n=1 Tax=Stephania yunnanensis TaxID=152371 RepID=A0AAP0FDV4_9MAGN
MVGFAVPTKKKIQSVAMVEWMETLLKMSFFGPCSDHQELAKNEAKVFCIDCNRCICQHCSSSDPHIIHNLLQIRRYVYHDVVRYQDIHKHFDCSKVQTYTTNNAKVVFLNPRPQPRPAKSSGGGAFCNVCERLLTEPNQFCSIACKYSVSPIKSRDKINERSDRSFSSFRFPEFNALSMKEELNQQDQEQQQQQSISNSYTGEMESSEDNQMSPPHSSSMITHSNSPNSKSFGLKPKKMMHKRKGVPHRSPLS